MAVWGLSAFVVNVRIAKDDADGPQALDEVMNPGRRRTLPSSDAPFETATTRKFIHFGPFRDATEEMSVISFWKKWYQENLTELGGNQER